ncbi:MAG: glycosyl hydrolase family 18 protein [bacterium]|nr:glycosyl hydrolase family 18 protein [bacterium]
MKLARLMPLFFAVVFVALPLSSAHAAARTMVFGTSGSDVGVLQSALMSKGYLSASATGYFGSLTLTAVKKFQCDSGIVCSGASWGVAGPQTQAALELAGVESAAVVGRKSSLEIGGWIPYWRNATGTQDVLPHLAAMTEISPFVFTIKSDGTLHDNGPLTEEPWLSFIVAAKKAKVRVIPTVMWGNGDAIHAILSDTKKRIALEDAIAAMVREGGYDGVDIDFEAKHAETKDYFSTFLKGLYARMGPKWVYCSIEARMPVVERYGYGVTPPADATEYANDYVAINKYCDRVAIMTYDQGKISALLNAARAAPYVPVADPAWVENVINLAAQTISKKKLLIGVATYGYEYSVTPKGDGYQYKLLWAFNQGYATQLAAQLGMAPIRNSAGELSFIYKSTPATDALAAIASTPGSVTVSQTNTPPPPGEVYSQRAIAGAIQPPFNIVWWSDAQAIADKVALARKLGVRGIAVFKFDGAEDQNIWGVLK